MKKFKYNQSLRTIDRFYETKFNKDQNYNPKITLKKIVNKDKNIYTLENVLSKKECENLIQTSNHAKYKSMINEYPTEIRDNKRILSFNNNLSDTIWERIYPFVKTLKDLKPCGFGIEGVWHPYSINNCFRFSRYDAPSIGFLPHRDAYFINGENKRSIMTLLIYLNDNFENGTTTFYKMHQKTRVVGETVTEEMKHGFNKEYIYKPKQGSIVIFEHNMVHSGDKVINGTKYIVRSDLIFQRISRPKEYDYSWRQSKMYNIARKMQREAANQELEGNVIKSAELYERALSYRQCYSYRYNKN